MSQDTWLWGCLSSIINWWNWILIILEYFIKFKFSKISICEVLILSLLEKIISNVMNKSIFGILFRWLLFFSRRQIFFSWRIRWRSIAFNYSWSANPINSLVSPNLCYFLFKSMLSFSYFFHFSFVLIGRWIRSASFISSINMASLIEGFDFSSILINKDYSWTSSRKS